MFRKTRMRRKSYADTLSQVVKEFEKTFGLRGQFDIDRNSGRAFYASTIQEGPIEVDLTIYITHLISVGGYRASIVGEVSVFGRQIKEFCYEVDYDSATGWSNITPC